MKRALTVLFYQHFQQNLQAGSLKLHHLKIEKKAGIMAVATLGAAHDSNHLELVHSQTITKIVSIG